MDPRDSTLQGIDTGRDGEGSPDERERDESLIARENWQRYRYGVERGHRNFTRLAQRLEGFYLGGDRDGDGRLIGGGQWSKEDLDILAEQCRPAYEFNEVKPAVDAALGHQIHNRMDIAFHPRGGDATQQLAEVRSRVAMQIADNNRLHWVETEVMGDGLIQQRGYFDIRMDFEDSVFGELKITSLDPMDVIPDPDAKTYDPKGWNDVIVTRWLTLDEIEGLYGEDARRKAEDELGRARDEGDFGDQHDDGAERNKFGDDSRGWRYDADYSGGEGIQRVRVIERQRWVRHVGDVAVYQNGDFRPLSGDEAPEVLEHIAAEGATIMRRRYRRVRWTVSTCETLLHDDWSPYDRFTVVPFFPYFRRGRTRGMVDNAISPQEALNKAASQYIHIINTTANSGWTVEEDSLTNMTTEELEETGSKTGLVLEYKKGTQPPRKIEPNQVPQGVAQLIDRATLTLKEVTVPDAMRGNQGAQESGVAIQSKQHAAQQVLAVPLDSMARSRAMVGAWIDYAIAKYYDTERVFRITKVDPVTGKDYDERLEINKFDPETGTYWNDMTAGEYDVVISEQPMQVTFENSQYQQALEMRRDAGVNLPDSVLIKHSNLSDKHDILAQIEKVSEEQADPLAEAEALLRQARAEKEKALARKHDAEAVSKGVEGIYSATQAGATIMQFPDVAPLADGLLRSAGFVDRDEAPIVPGADDPAAMRMAGEDPMDGMPDELAPQTNTNPMFPPRANPSAPADPGSPDLMTPDRAAAGARAGIETQEIEGI